MFALQGRAQRLAFFAIYGVIATVAILVLGWEVLCSTYWNRGATICGNGLMAAMPETDRAVRDFLRAEVLQPRIIERALDLAAVSLQERDAGRGSSAEVIRTQLSKIETELANLAETVARDGAIPAVLEALRRRDEERRRLTVELSALAQPPTSALKRPTDLRARLRRSLADWNGLLDENSAGARRVLDIILTDRIRFTSDSAHRRYELTIPVAFNRIVAAVPALREGLEEMMASPSIPSWNQIAAFLESMRQLQAAVGAAA